MGRRKPRLQAAALLGSLALCLAAAGCGGSAAQVVLRKATVADRQVRSGVLHLSLTLNGKPSAALGAPFSLGVSGPYESKGAGKVPSFALALTLGSAGTSLNLGFTSTGSALYLIFGGAPYKVPQTAFEALERSYAEAPTPTAPAGVEPLKWLEGPTKEGEGSEGGVAVERFSANLNRKELFSSLAKLAPLGASLGALRTRYPAFGSLLEALAKPQGRRALEGALSEARLNLSLGKRDHILRALSLRLDLKPSGAAVALLGGIREAVARLSVKLEEVNEKQQIGAPSGARPLEDLISEAGQVGL